MLALTPPGDNHLVSLEVTQNQAQVYECNNQQVIGFCIGNREMVCLPQVYELFLKQLVGGLHTVYTKLKRLNIHPVVCNVEQIRALRSLGAIQPGVNRCKLIEKRDFEKLPQSNRPAKQSVNEFSLNSCGSADLKQMSLKPPLEHTFSDTSEVAVSKPATSNSEKSHLTENLNFDISQLFPFATQFAMEQLMLTLVTRHPGLSPTASMTLDATKSGEKFDQCSNPQSQQEQPQVNNGSKKSDNTFEWNVKRDKTDFTFRHENSITSNNANAFSSSLPTIPGFGRPYNSSNSSSNLSNFSFDREKSTSLAYNSGYSSGSSANTPPQILEIQSFVTKFSRTVASLENRFVQQYEKLSALATTLQTTMEKINNREEYLLLKLHQHKERSHHYFHKYLIDRRYPLALRRRSKRGKAAN